MPAPSLSLVGFVTFDGDCDCACDGDLRGIFGIWIRTLFKCALGCQKNLAGKYIMPVTFTSVPISITPSSMAETNDGNIAMINGLTSTVTIVSPQGALIRTFSLSFIPKSIAIDTQGTGHMYFSDHSENRYYRTDSSGSVITQGNTISGDAIGPVAVSASGTVYCIILSTIYTLDASLQLTAINATTSILDALCMDSNTLYATTSPSGIFTISATGDMSLFSSAAAGTSIAVANGIVYVSNGANLFEADINNTITIISNGGWKAGALLALSSGKLVVADGKGTTLYISSVSNGGQHVVPCFLADAPVLTPAGYAAISSLSAGDKVMTGDGRAVAIQNVSHTRIAAGPSVNPYVIPKGLYGSTVRLLISPDHRVSTANGMVEARRLGLEQSEMEGEIDYYNLELPSWSQDTMVVAGVVVESLAPVRRVTMTLAAFKKALVAQYGELTPAVLAKVQKTCRLVAGGRVECPVLRK